MTEFLTENARRAYPLEREWPDALRDPWAATLVDACVYASAELGPDERLSLLSVRKSGESVTFVVGVPGGASLDVEAVRGLGGFATVYAGTPGLKAVLTVDGRRIDALLAAAGTEGGDVGVPFAMRCCGGGTRRVTSLTAQGAESCTTPAYDPDDPHKIEQSAGSGEHAVLKAGEGLDLEAVGMAPLAGTVLRVSAIAAQEAGTVDEEPVDMMVRGDECFSVEAIPGAKVADGGAVVPRTDGDRPGGVVRITSTCKPCCQCEDYKDAVDLLGRANDRTVELDGLLDDARREYDAALALYAAVKREARAQTRLAANVRTSATATLSGGLYGASTAAGTRQRIAVTLLVENMSTADATVTVGADATGSGFAVGGGYVHSGTKWAKGGGQQAYGSDRPVSQVLKPGETLTVVALYCKADSTTNAADRPDGMKAYCSITVDGTTSSREVDVQ